MLQQSLKAAGLELSIEYLQPQAAWVKVKTNTYDIFIAGFSTRADPHNVLFDQFHTGGGFVWLSAPGNLQVDSEVDAALDRANETYDREERKARYTVAQDLIINKYAYTAVTNYKNNYVATSSKVANTGPLIGGEGKLRYAELYQVS